MTARSARRPIGAAVLSPLARQILALGLALGVVALALAYPLRGYLAQQQAEQQAMAEQQQLQDTVADLRAHVAALHDPAYIRQQAKQRLQYVTPGDTVYVVKVPGRGVGDGASSSWAWHDNVPAAGDHDGDRGTGTDVDDAPAHNQLPEQQPWYVPLWGTLTGDDDTQ